jgi:hypothetical protein
MGFLAGVLEEANRQEDAATRAEEFMMSQLDKLKGVIIPELMQKIKTRTENAAETKARIDYAQTLGLSERSAYALEVTGQLEYELPALEKVGKNKIAENFIKTLDATITNQIDNDEDIAKGISAGIAAMKKNMTAQDSTNALMKAMYATTRDEFEDAMEGVTVKTITMPEVEDFEYRPTGGRSQIESSELSRMDQRIAQSLQTTFGQGYTVDPQKEGGLGYISFQDDDLSRLFTKLAEEARLRATSAELGVGGSPSQVSLFIGQTLQNARQTNPTTQQTVVSEPLSIFNNLDKILANPGGFDWSSLPTTNLRTPEDDNLNE